MNIYISKNNFLLLNKIYNDYKPVEVGGVLIGKKEHGRYIITNIVYNINRSNLNRCKFVRNIEVLKDVMKELIIQSKYTIDYIGEWHTHPNYSSSYSNLDKIAMVELNEDFQELILLIKGEFQTSAFLFIDNKVEKLEIIIK